MTSVDNDTRSGLSYAAAAKALRTSELSVSARLALASRLLERAPLLQPHPAPLVLQHVLYALSAGASASFDEYRAQYWRLLVEVLAAEPGGCQGLPQSLALCASEALVKDEGEELEACVRAVRYIVDTGAMSPTIEVLSGLVGAACALSASRGTAVDVDVDELAVVLLEQYEDVQRRCPTAKRSFTLALDNLLLPIMQCKGHVLAVGSRVLAAGLFAAVGDVLLLKSYYSSLYQWVASARTLEVCGSLPEAISFLLRACIRVSRVDSGAIAGSSISAGASRSAGSLKRPRSEGSEGALHSHSGLSLPRHIVRPLIFFKELCNALKSNLQSYDDAKAVTFHDADCEVHVLEAVTRLFDVATELGLYRPSYDLRPKTRAASKKKAKSSKHGKPGEEIAAPDAGNQELQVGKDIAAMLSLLTAFLPSADGRGAVVRNVTRTMNAVVQLSLDSVQTCMPSVLDAIAGCSSEVGLAADVKESLANLFCGLIQTHADTRQLPTLFRYLSSNESGFVLLERLSVILQEGSVQLRLAESVEALPRGQSELCIRSLLKSGAPLSAASTPAVCFLVSLHLESTAVAEIPSLVSALCDILAPKLLDVISTGASFRCSVAFLCASVCFALTRASLSRASTTHEAFLRSGIADIVCDQQVRSAEALVEALAEREVPADAVERFCIIRLLASLAHFHINQEDVTRVSSAKLAREASQAVWASFVGIEVIEDVASPAFIANHENQWRGLLLGSLENTSLATVRIAGSICSMMDHVTAVRGSATDAEVFTTPVGLQQFLALAMVHSQFLDELWQDLLETRVVRELFPDTAGAVLMKKLKCERNCGSDECPEDAGACMAVSVLRLVQSLPEAYLNKEGQVSLANVCAKFYRTAACQAAQELALRIVVALGANCLSAISATSEDMVGVSGCEGLILTVASWMRVTESRAHGRKILQSVADMCIERDLTATCWFVDGLRLMLTSVREEMTLTRIEYEEAMWNLVSELGKKVVVRLASLATVGLGEGGGTAMGARDTSDSGFVVAVSSLLGLKSALVEAHSLLGDREAYASLNEAVTNCLQALIPRALQGCASSLATIPSLRSTLRFRAVKKVLMGLCEGRPPMYRLITGAAAAPVLLNRLSAYALHWIASDNVRVRSVGVEVLATLASNESKGAVDELGCVVEQQLQSIMDSSAECVRSKCPELTRKLCAKAHAAILAGATLLCGTGVVPAALRKTEVGTGVVIGFKAIRGRRDLSGFRMNRAVSGRLATLSLRALNAVFESIAACSGSHGPGSAGEVARILAWDAATLAVQTAELCAELRAPHRIEVSDAHLLLEEVSSLVCVECDVEQGARHEALRRGVARLCSALLHNLGKQSGSGVAWGTTRAARAILSLGNQLRAGTAGEVSRIYSTLAGAGRSSAAQAALGDAVTLLARVQDAGVRRAIVPGVAALLKAVGEDGARAVMVAVQEDAKDVLRAMREEYVEDFQYSGK